MSTVISWPTGRLIVKVTSHIFIFIFFISSRSLACSFKQKTNIFSLSGPVSMLLEFMQLENDTAIKGISVFHPIENYKGKRLGGGVFLSPKVFKNTDSAVVFFDESKELKKSLNQIKKIKKIEVSTRGQNSFESTSYALNLIKPYLVDCKQQIQKVENYMESVDSKVNNWTLHKEMIFFLDKINDRLRLPTTLIVNDGFVLTLLQRNKINTYKSPLAYVNWSSKLLEKEYKKFLKIGVVDHKNNKELEIQKVNKNHYNIFFKGSLIPGISQLILLEKLSSMSKRIYLED